MKYKPQPTKGEKMIDKDNPFSDMTEEELEDMYDEQAKQEQKEEDDAIAEAEDPEAGMDQHIEDEQIRKAEEEEEDKMIERQIEDELIGKAEEDDME